jgi:hypothetical protein
LEIISNAMTHILKLQRILQEYKPQFIPILIIREGRVNRRRKEFLQDYPNEMRKSSRKSDDVHTEWVLLLLSPANIDRSLTCCCCGFRFGWSAIIGIIPFVGDLLNVLIALSIIRTCMEVELPKHIVQSLIIPG